MLIDPKDIDIEDQSGINRRYIVSKMPYLNGGREVCSQFISTALPKLGNYQENQKLAEKMFSFIEAVNDDGRNVLLSTKEMVNNHVPDFQTGIKLEAAMIEHNVGFSVTGKIREYREGWEENISGSIIKILIQLRDALQQADKPAYTSSEPSIP